MTEHHHSSDLPRLVVLALGPSGSQKVLSLPEGPYRAVRTENGFEAAAELLSASAVALVVELRALTRPHLRLLGLARDLGVEVLGIGPIPVGISTDQLSGVRLLATEDLPAAIERLTKGRQPLAVPDAAELLARAGQGVESEPTAGVESSSEEAGPPAEPVGYNALNDPEDKLTDAADQYASHPGPENKRPRKTTGAEPVNLLTPEELAALLGEQP